MSTFSIQQLRQKYKKIIESQDSDQENINKNRVTFSIKKSLNQTRVLTQHCQNMSQSKVKNYASNTTLVALKERIAQGIHNLSEKDKEIEDYKVTIIQQKSEISSLQNQIKQLRIALEDTNNKVVQGKINAAGLEKQIQKLKVVIKDQQIDKELVFKQIQFYKKQIKDLKNEKKQLDQLLQKTKKQIQKVDKIKSDNSRLKDNIDRMQIIINQCCQQSVKINLTDKYYLGKPIKESNCWFSQNLIGQVESFLKKWQIGTNNKDFINSLVKFIDQYKKFSKSSSCSKPKKAKSSHIDSESKRYSTSMQGNFELQSANKSRIQKSLKKSILINKYKKRHNRMYSQSLFEQENKLKRSKVYEQIIDEYQKALKMALEQSQIKPKKIMLLSKQLKESFNNFMEETK